MNDIEAKFLQFKTAYYNRVIALLFGITGYTWLIYINPSLFFALAAIFMYEKTQPQP